MSNDSNYTRFKSGRWDLSRYLWSNAKREIGEYNKSTIDFNAIDSWQKLGDYLSISHNGEYFAYTVEGVSRSFDSDRKADSLIVQSMDNSLRLVFVGARPGFFTGDSKQYVFQEGTRLCFLRLDGGQTKYLEDVASYKELDKGRDEWLAYKLKNSNSDVILRNLITGRERVFSGVSEYEFSGGGEWLICQNNSNDKGHDSKVLLLYQLVTGMERRFPSVADYLFAEKGSAVLTKTVKKIQDETVTALEYVNFPEGRVKVIWSTKDSNISISSYNMDKLGEQIVFSVQDSAGYAIEKLISSSIWYFKKGMDKSTVKVTNGTAGIDNGMQVEGSVSFTDNGRYIQFLLQPMPFLGKPKPDAVQLDVWNHKDLVLQSAQSDRLKRPQEYNSIVNVENGRVLQLENENKTLHLLQGDFAIVKKLSKDTYGDRFWEEGYGYEKDSNWLVALNDGSRHLLSSKGGNATTIGPFWFSPSGNYLVYFDFDKGCRYFSYDLRTGKRTDISADDDVGQLGYINPYLRSDRKPEYPLGIAAWLERDGGVLVYDNNDIWKMDLRGKKSAINLTNSFGRSHNIIFSLINSQRFDRAIPVLNEHETLLLRAFNTKNKYNGFYRKVAGADGDPELLYMGGYFMNIIPGCQDPNLSNSGMKPSKARDANVWIVQRQSDTKAPNYYKTIDFKSFVKLTDFQPQKGYNWLFEELHSFDHLDGTKGQGILYKPENFDSSKKYPVIIVFYGGFSNNLYQFPTPAYNRSAITPGISPVWFLNNGYLVFTPDIYVAPLKYGPEAFNVIEGAARYLKQLPYVNVDKLGCCSHSWSAKLGSYLFTHSKSFNAMVISEGFLYANMINVALSTEENGTSRLEDVEEGFQFGSLWENKNSWLDQTTVLNVNNATSPLLLLCNGKSSKDYQNQTLQLFVALRRLEKKVWWLKYDKGEHNLFDLDDRRDFTIRDTQFFDHYLKGAPAPRWMTQGIPTRLKGFEAGYDLDPGGSCGKDCKICKKWNEQYKKHSEMFSKPISEWHLN